MPYGADKSTQRWFKGWYEVVIEPAVVSCGLEPILSAAEEQPGAINDEIRSHLVFDPMVVVDLGGVRPEEPPNPNVMYELGIRHAFGLPVVTLAWEGQQLPFDVGNQRAITTERGLLDLEPTRQKLVTFIQAATDGRYYNPMEAVGREASIDATSLVLGEDSMLAALANEVRSLRNSLQRNVALVSRGKRLKVRTQMGKQMKVELWPVAQQLGFEAGSWSRFLNLNVTPPLADVMENWSLSEWEDYMGLGLPHLVAAPEPKLSLEEEIIESVAVRLPEQPWPSGIHKEVAEKLGLTATTAQRAIQELIKRGRFLHQKDGMLFRPVSPPPAVPKLPTEEGSTEDAPKPPAVQDAPARETSSEGSGT
jgi:hypothetical protein